MSEGSLEASELALGVGGNPLRLGGSRIAANIAKLPDLLKRSVMRRLAFFRLRFRTHNKFTCLPERPSERLVRCGAFAMLSIERFYSVTGSFDPDATRTLGLAFDKACALLGRTPQPTAVREAIAKVSSKLRSRVNVIPTAYEKPALLRHNNTALAVSSLISEGWNEL